MAPNRKQLQSIVDDTPFGHHQTNDLRSTIQSKFLPLTDPRSPAQLDELDRQNQQEQLQQQQQQQQQEPESYWDWHTPDDVPPQDEEEEDENNSTNNKSSPTVDLFSIAHLEANLIADSQKYATKTSTATPVVDDEPEHDIIQRSIHASIVPQHQQQQQQHNDTSNYWDWSVKTSDYEEELANKITSSSHIVQNLIGTKTQYPPTPPSKSSSNDDAYWRWNTTATTSTNDVDETSSPADSHNYWTWHTTNVPNENQLQQQQVVDSDTYWEWTTSSQMNQLMNEEWVDSITTVHAVIAHGGKGYWDW